MRVTRTIVLLGALLLPACSVERKPEEEAGDVYAAAEGQVRARLDSLIATTNAGQSERLVDLWATDARLLEPGLVINGESEIRGLHQANRVTDLSVSTTQLVAHDSGAVVYQFGKVYETITPRAGGTPNVVRANFAARWTKDGSGTWRIHRFLSTPLPKDSVPVSVTTLTRNTTLSQDDAAAIEQVAARSKEYEAAIAAGDAARVLSFWGKDGEVMEPEAHMVGEAGITPMMQYFFGAFRIEGLHFNPTETYVHDGGNVLYQIGDYSQSLIPKDGSSPPINSSNHYMTRWRRDSAGNWLIDRMIATPQPATARSGQR